MRFWRFQVGDRVEVTDPTAKTTAWEGTCTYVGRHSKTKRTLLVEVLRDNSTGNQPAFSAMPANCRVLQRGGFVRL